MFLLSRHEIENFVNARIEGKLDLDELLVRTRFDVGIGGTALNIDTRTEKVGIFTATTTGYANELYDWTLDETLYANIVTAGGASPSQGPPIEQEDRDSGYAGGAGGSGASTSSVRARQVTIACKSAGVLGGQDRQVVLSAVGVQSGKPTTVTINLVRD